MIRNFPEEFLKQTNLRSMSVDSEEARERVQNENNKVKIDVVPSILLIQPDGGVIKYEGEQAFIWASEIGNRIIQEIQQAQMPRPRIAESPITPLEDLMGENNVENSIENFEEGVQTNISYPPDIPDNRHISMPIPRAIANNRQELEPDSTFFAAEKPDTRKQPNKRMMKKTAKKTESDPHGTLARARELESGREQIEGKYADQKKRPMLPDRRV